MRKNMEPKGVHDPFHLLDSDIRLQPQEPMDGQLVFWTEKEGEADE